MPAFVLEIGTEELPARFLAPTEKELADKFGDSLREKGLVFSDLITCSTPRRLVVHIHEMSEAALSREEVITGPPVKVCYDMGGRPTRAAEGFARTHGIKLEDAFTLETEKGAYMAVKKKVGGGDALSILAEICPAIISGLSFAKKMHWGDGDFTFARPIRWILALFGSQQVAFTVGKVTSGNSTRGHRVHGPGPFTLDDASDYFRLMREQCHVSVSSSERRRIICEGGDALAMEKKGRILWKESLMEEVQGLSEHPVPILGSFDSTFLEIPRQVLLTSMESHQKSFGVEGESGRLLPHFLTVLNINPQDPDLVRKGWERVLRARLEDARFFWQSDLANGSFDNWLTSLDSVIFLAPLGSMGDKTRRIEKLCGWLADNSRWHSSRQALSKDDLTRAGRLCKSDLVSEMVKEFDTLQGIMGGIYAAKFDESDNVSAAIAEQYLPSGPESPVPSNPYGCILSIADKADTLAGCFGLGMIPTGTADPYALRRAALGIARIALEAGLRFDASALFASALEGYGEREWKLHPEQALARLGEFFSLRVKNHFISGGAETLLTEAILHAGADDVWAASARLSALIEFSQTPDFAGSVLTFKRAANIIRKYAQENEDQPLSGRYLTDLFSDVAEKALAAELERIVPVFDDYWNTDRYAELFGLLRDLRPSVDAFFEQVMVMCEDEAVRLNRLNLLQALVHRLSRLADFSALQM